LLIFFKTEKYHLLFGGATPFFRDSITL